MDDKLSPEDEAMLSRCMSRFQCRLMLIRMGIPLQPKPHPVSDEQYRRAIEDDDGLTDS